MADFKKMIPWVKKWEGGYVNDPDDNGGCTCKGITIKVFRKYFGSEKTCEDLKHITDDEWTYIFKRGYWDRMKGDNIESQSVAEICVQMAWGSGAFTAAKKIQNLVGAKVDGIIGNKTIEKINSYDGKELFFKLKEMRKEWLIEISKKGNNKKFLKGWLNRLEDLKYKG